MYVNTNLAALMMYATSDQSAVVVPPAVNAAASFGVTASDVTSYSAVLWSRGDRASFMHVQVLGPTNGLRKQVARVTAEHDFTGKIQMSGLRPATEYRYRVWFSEDSFGHRVISDAVEGVFRTPPAPDAAVPVSFTWGDGVGGENSRRATRGDFPIFKAIGAPPQDPFVGLGDMLYAEGTCDAIGRYGNARVADAFLAAANMPEYWNHRNYNRADAGAPRRRPGSGSTTARSRSTPTAA